MSDGASEGSSDVVIVGGGVIGLSLAWELAEQGRSVVVLEQGDFGREASWAGAGILPPGNPASTGTPEAKLRGFSASLWKEWTERLRESTGIDNGYRTCGGLIIPMGESTAEAAAHWTRDGIEVQSLAGTELAAFLPNLDRAVAAALYLPAVCQVRNPRHLKALVAACQSRGVRLVSGSPVIGFDRAGERILAVLTSSGRFTAGQVCITAGAWTKTVLSWAGAAVQIEPVRGQIVLLQASPLPFRCIIEEGKRYLVPRPDGRILIGSTEDRVGFDRSNTASGVAGLISFATRLVPALQFAKIERFWAGLRPGSPTELPILGPVPGFGNLFVAAGHFRAGLQMSPGTAVLMRQAMSGQRTGIPLHSYAASQAIT